MPNDLLRQLAGNVFGYKTAQMDGQDIFAHKFLYCVKFQALKLNQHIILIHAYHIPVSGIDLPRQFTHPKYAVSVHH